MRSTTLCRIIARFYGLCLAMPGWSELPLYFPESPGNRTSVRYQLVLDSVVDRRGGSQASLQGGEGIRSHKEIWNYPQELWNQPLATELGLRLARDFAVASLRADTIPSDTLRVDVSVTRFHLKPSAFFSPAEADIAMEFRTRTRDGESDSSDCQSHRTIPLGECFSNGTTFCANIAAGLVLRGCIEEFYRMLPGTSWQKSEETPISGHFQEYAEAISESDTAVREMRHRWGIGYGATLLGQDRDHPMSHGGRFEYSYERSLFKGSVRMASNFGDSAGEGSWTFLLGLGARTDPDVLTGFVQGLGGWHWKRVSRSGAEKAILSNRMLHRDSPELDGAVGFNVLGIRSGLDFDWDRRGSVGGGLEISAMVAGLWGRIGEDDPWWEAPPDDISKLRFEVEALLCLRL